MAGIRVDVDGLCSKVEDLQERLEIAEAIVQNICRIYDDLELRLLIETTRGI